MRIPKDLDYWDFLFISSRVDGTGGHGAGAGGSVLMDRFEL